MDVEYYAGLITERNYRREKYMEYVRMLIREAVGIQNIINDLPYAFDLDNAAGDQLDVLGSYVGVSRRLTYAVPLGTSPDMDDEVYRMAIRAKIMQNHWDGSNEGFVNIWKSVVGEDIVAELKDNQNMSVTVEITGEISSTLRDMILNGYVIPKPAGVMINIRINGDSVGTMISHLAAVTGEEIIEQVVMY